jgi:hypothetical protein
MTRYGTWLANSISRSLLTANIVNAASTRSGKWKAKDAKISNWRFADWIMPSDFPVTT